MIGEESKVSSERLKNAEEKLNRIGQIHLLKWWPKIPAAVQEGLLKQIEDIDVSLFKKQQAQLTVHTPTAHREILPIHRVEKCGDRACFEMGLKALREGKAGALVVAGGQGSRLGFEHPKGMYPVTAARKKSLFQLVSEKTKACGMMVEKDLPLALMTSKDNDDETRRYFQANRLFDLSKDQLGFFTQSSLPLLDTQGRLFLEDKGKIASGPDGNGSSIGCFARSPLYEQWKKQGVQYVVFTLIDNPLADPFDAELIGRAMKDNCDVVVKAVERRDVEEKVGILAEVDGKTAVIEYTEFPKDLWTERGRDGALRFHVANISLFCLSMDFIRRVHEHYFQEMPLHKAFKAVPYLDSFGSIVRPNHPFAWKFERFIFDFLPFAGKIETVIYPRESCFSPLKNAEGDSSPEKVRHDLTARDRTIVKSLFSKEPPPEIVEVSQEFHYPTQELLERYRNKELPAAPYLDSYRDI